MKDPASVQELRRARPVGQAADRLDCRDGPPRDGACRGRTYAPRPGLRRGRGGRRRGPRYRAVAMSSSPAARSPVKRLPTSDARQRQFLSGDWRLPIWPRGYLGSISHSGGLCVAHVGRRSDLLGIGVDVERPNALPPRTARRRGVAGGMGRPIAPTTRQVRTSTRARCAFRRKRPLTRPASPRRAAFLEYTDLRLEGTGRTAPSRRRS